MTKFLVNGHVIAIYKTHKLLFLLYYLHGRKYLTSHLTSNRVLYPLFLGSKLFLLHSLPKPSKQYNRLVFSKNDN